MKTEIIISETPTIKDFEQRIDDDSLDSTHYAMGTGLVSLSTALITLDVRLHGTVIINSNVSVNFYYCSYFGAGYLEGDIEYPFPKGDAVQKYMWKLAKWTITNHVVEMIPDWHRKTKPVLKDGWLLKERGE